MDATQDPKLYNEESSPEINQSLRIAPMQQSSTQQSALSKRSFMLLLLLAELLGVAAVTMVIFWLGHFQGGFDFKNNVFNYHPTFMIIGLIFLYGNGILMYRAFRVQAKLPVKIAHACVQGCALVCASIGLKATFDFHRLNSMPTLFSIHSWLGLTTVILFGMQWASGFMSFLWPKLGVAGRQLYLPYHNFWGIAILCLAGATVLMGVTERAFTVLKNYSKYTPEAILVNCLSLSVVAFITVVVFVMTRSEFKRPPGPEDQHIQLTQ